MRKPSIFTVGHSTKTIEEFVEMLRAHGVGELVDIRTVPKSRHNPQFGGASLERSLRKAGIGYRHLAALGGLRRATKESKNTGWRNASFRGYADYMATAEFAQGLEELMHLARKQNAAIMCAEAVPWRCHRSLVADALIKEGWNVMDIMSATKTAKHKLTPFLRMRKGQITYPPEAAERAEEKRASRAAHPSPKGRVRASARRP